MTVCVHVVTYQSCTWSKFHVDLLFGSKSCAQCRYCAKYSLNGSYAWQYHYIHNSIPHNTTSPNFVGWVFLLRNKVETSCLELVVRQVIHIRCTHLQCLGSVCMVVKHVVCGDGHWWCWWTMMMLLCMMMDGGMMMSLRDRHQFVSDFTS